MVYFGCLIKAHAYIGEAALDNSLKGFCAPPRIRDVPVVAMSTVCVVGPFFVLVHPIRRHHDDLVVKARGASCTRLTCVDHRPTPPVMENLAAWSEYELLLPSRAVVHLMLQEVVRTFRSPQWIILAISVV